MIIVTATGGSGSSFIRHEFKEYGWDVCKRPDKIGNEDVFCDRIKSLMRVPKSAPQMDDGEKFEYIKDRIGYKSKKLLLSWEWGAKGMYRGYSPKPIYMFRDPVFTLNSFSGGGWYPKVRDGRIREAGCSTANSAEWVDAFFGRYGLWEDLARVAIEEVSHGLAHILRYDRFESDWKRIDYFVPPIYKSFDCKDDMDKVRKFLTDDTIEYIRERAGELWRDIQEL